MLAVNVFVAVSRTDTVSDGLFVTYTLAPLVPTARPPLPSSMGTLATAVFVEVSITRRFSDTSSPNANNTVSVT